MRETGFILSWNLEFAYFNPQDWYSQFYYVPVHSEKIHKNILYKTIYMIS